MLVDRQVVRQGQAARHGQGGRQAGKVRTGRQGQAGRKASKHRQAFRQWLAGVYRQEGTQGHTGKQTRAGT
jgi:hypothetical protein